MNAQGSAIKAARVPVDTDTTGGPQVTINVHLDNATILGDDRRRVAAALAGDIRAELLKYGARNGSVGLA